MALSCSPAAGLDVTLGEQTVQSLQELSRQCYIIGNKTEGH